MTTDVQVSNARMWGFTALALVAFWILSFGAYSLGCHLIPLGSGLNTWFSNTERRWVILPLWNHRELVSGPLLALMPFAFLSLSCYNSPNQLRDHRILIAGLLFATCIGSCFWVGERSTYREYLNPWRNHFISWYWLLLPIILTTAFVIFGAWRRAVRDADVAVVDESE